MQCPEVSLALRAIRSLAAWTERFIWQNKIPLNMGCSPFLQTALGGAVCVTPSSRLLYFSNSVGAAGFFDGFKADLVERMLASCVMHFSWTAACESTSRPAALPHLLRAAAAAATCARCRRSAGLILRCTERCLALSI